MSATNLDLVLDIPVKLTVELGSCQLPMREVLQLAPGSIVQLDKTANSPVAVFVNQRLIARGEVVVIEDRLGIKVTEILGKEA
jgi:flagellar motor switch protein FliN/FliY